MKLLFFSDVHDHLVHLERFALDKPDCDVAIGCGDYCAPFLIGLMAEMFSCPLHLVWGNNDGDRALQRQIASRFEHVVLEGESLDREWGGRRVFVNHYPAIAAAVFPSGRYDLVAYGHDHVAMCRQENGSVLLNPGSIMGYQPGKRTHVLPSFAVYDTESGEVEIRELPG